MAKRRQQRRVPGAAAGRGSPPAPSTQVRGTGRPNRPPRGSAPAKPRGLLGGADPWRIGIVGAVVLGVVVLVVAIVAGGGSAGRYTCAQQLAPGGTPEDGQVTVDQGRQHTSSGSQLNYLFCPPASGVHYNTEANFAPARAGFYRPDANIGPGNWIHNLEHGYVVALYRCADGVCPSEEVLAEMRRFVNDGPQTPVAANCGIRSKIVAARFDAMSTPFALLTWNRVLLLDSFDVDDALAFAQKWMEKEAPESGNC